MENPFLSLKEALEKKEQEFSGKKFRSERNEQFFELYGHYAKSYKKNMWANYISWLKQNKFKHSKEKVEQFKKISYPLISEKSFCSYWLGFIKTKDLYFLNSIARDKEQRNENFNKWLFWAIKNRDG